jgi:hypothetical protein
MSAPAPIFCDTLERPPPPQLLLTAQTDLHAHLTRPSKLLAQESLGSIRVQLHAADIAAEALVHAQHHRIKGRGLAPEGSHVTPLDTSDDEDNNDSTIPKPNGEVSRPGRGGYNLDAILPLSADVIAGIKACDALCQLQYLMINVLLGVCPGPDKGPP